MPRRGRQQPDTVEPFWSLINDSDKIQIMPLVFMDSCWVGEAHVRSEESNSPRSQPTL